MKLFCLDLETTGLDPEKDLILEIGALACDHFQPQAHFHRVIGRGAAVLEDCIPEGKVREMHQASGLWEACLVSNVSLYQAVTDCVAFYHQHFGDERVPLMGANPSFDRGFLQAYAGQLHDLLHYRNFDTNSLWLLREGWQGQGLKGNEVKPGTAHRALEDCYQAVGEVQKMLTWACKV